MKILPATCLVLTVVIGGLYLAVGGTILLIVLAVLGITTFVISIFILGMWFQKNAIMTGVKIAMEATANNDKWDSVKMQSLARFGGDIFRLKQDNTTPQQKFGMLEPGKNIFDLYPIQNLPDEPGNIEKWDSRDA